MVTRIDKTTDPQAPDPTHAALDAMADQATANSAPPPEPAPKDDHLERDLLDMLRMVQAVASRGMWWLTPDEFESLWGERVLRGIAEPGAEIMRRHGWTVSDTMGKYGPYIALAAAAAPSAIATVQAYKAAQVTPRAPAAPATEEASHGDQAG